jgi:hypothetical protein
VTNQGDVIDNPVTGETIVFLKRAGDTDGQVLQMELRGDARANAWRNYLDAAGAIARLTIDGDEFGETTGWGGTPLRERTWTGFLLASIDRTLRERRDILSRDVPGFETALNRVRQQDCAMLAGGPFLGCAGGPLP